MLSVPAPAGLHLSPLPDLLRTPEGQLPLQIPVVLAAEVAQQSSLVEDDGDAIVHGHLGRAASHPS